MKNAITDLEIKNFKSIEHLKLECNRINVFIGKPNSGKSNILEALTLFNPGVNSFEANKFFKGTIRCEKFDQLFHFLNTDKNIEVKSNIGSLNLRSQKNTGIFDLIIGDEQEIIDLGGDLNKESIGNIINRINQINTTEEKILLHFGPIGLFYGYFSRYPEFPYSSSSSPQYVSPIKRYQYQVPEYTSDLYSDFLKPSGVNIYQILARSVELKNFVGTFFREFNLDFWLDSTNYTFEIVKKDGMIATKLPYSSVPDTLKRMLYHLAAIYSNKDSVLLFEEPEAHSFPGFVTSLSERIIANIVYPIIRTGAKQN